ncbi:MAG TPA: MFS transporter [Vicinamibacterales bacterium]|nr:MFS transporter [Vicinamibacterales bacterium]
MIGPDARRTSPMVTTATPIGHRTMARVRRRLIPFLATMYFVAYLDRVNVGFAALQMNAALGLSSQVFGLGAGIFFLGYFLFEIPSNYALARVGARIWIARIAIVWGIVSVTMLFITGPRSFYAMRFLLGAAEAGFFPGIVLYFTFWFPAPERAKAVAQFSTASMVAGIVGAPLSGVLLSLRGAGGLDGWQWLFLVEGLPAIALGVVALWYLTDTPAQARWLSDEERAWLVEAMRCDRADTSRPAAHSLRAGLLDPIVWRLALSLFLVVTSGYGFSFFLPQIVKAFSGLSDLAVGIVSAIPFFVAAIGMVTVAAHSDRTGERRRHVAACGCLAAAGLACASFVASPLQRFAALSIAAIGLYSFTPPFWSLPTAFLRGDAAAAGIAFINATGNLGGFLGPYVMGWMKDATGDYLVGLRLLATAALVSGVVVFLGTRTVSRATAETRRYRSAPS